MLGMTKTRCPNCKEFPFRWRWAAIEGGKECSLCGYIRPTKSRRSVKRAKLDGLIAELLGKEAA